jgi:hypothetical protein
LELKPRLRSSSPGPTTTLNFGSCFRLATTVGGTSSTPSMSPCLRAAIMASEFWYSVTPNALIFGFGP